MKIFNGISAVVASFVFIITGPALALAAGPATVNLGMAGNFAIVAKTAISTTGSTSVTGDIGVSPAASTCITGFGLILPAASTFSTSALITGKIYAPGYADPTSAQMTATVLDMQNAYTDANGRAPNVTELGAGNIGGMTLVPGVYKWGTSLNIPTDVTLSGGANDIWIFQVAQNLIVGSGAKILLSGGAQANNIFWVVAGQTTLGTTAVFNGNILDQTSIILNTGARLTGRALAQAAVTLDANTVTTPTYIASTVVVPVVTTPVTTTSNTNTTNTNNTTNTTATAPINYSGAMQAPQYLQDQVNVLLTTVRSLQAQVLARQQNSIGATVSGQGVGSITIDLAEGSRDNAVATLQEFLVAQNKGPASQALSYVGRTTYFGALTRAALSEFQESVGINPALGIFGPITRSYISAHY